jgi:PTS system mannose-specific IIA component
MIGLVVVTHGRLAVEFVAVMEHVLGPQENIATVCIGPHDDMEERRQDILAAVKKVEQGDGVVILTDLFGGTPSNLSISVMQETKAEVIAGVNLPLLIKLGEARKTENLPDAVAKAREAGQKYINVASALLSM